MTVESAAESRFVAWLGRYGGGDEAPLGPLDDEFFAILASHFLVLLAERCGARHSRLPKATREQWVVNRRAGHAARQCVATLRRSGIGCVILRGDPLSMAAYGAADLRPDDDVDVLVTPRDFTGALEALTATGLVFLADGPRASRRSRLSNHIDLLPARPPGAKVELHWDYLRPVVGSGDVPGLLSAAVNVACGGATLPAPDQAWQLVTCAVHALDHLCRPLHMLDLALLARRLTPSDWARVVDISLADGIGTGVLCALRQSARILDWRLPGEIGVLERKGLRRQAGDRYLQRLPFVASPPRRLLQIQHATAPWIARDSTVAALGRLPVSLATLLSRAATVPRRRGTGELSGARLKL